MTKQIDLTGQVFNHITVIRAATSDEIKSASGKYWLCRCSCGKEMFLRSDKIRDRGGRYNVSYCWHTKRSRQMAKNGRLGGKYKSGALSNAQDTELYLGKKINMLTLMCFTKYGKHGGRYIMAQCDCGNIITLKFGDWLKGARKSCGCLKRGHTDEARRDRNSTKYRQFIYSCFMRDSFRCRKCNKGGNLHVHHIIPFSKDKEQRFNITNGITLCPTCHWEFHNLMGGWRQTEYTPKDFWCWYLNCPEFAFPDNCDILTVETKEVEDETK